MRINIGILAVVCCVVLAGPLLVSKTQPITSDEDKAISVVATIYPLAYFASNLDPSVAVTTIVGPGREPHDYEPTISDEKTLSDADLILYNGGIDEWAIHNMKGDRVLLRALGTLGLPDSDPHAWLDPVYAQELVRTIGKELARFNPEHAEIIGQNVEMRVAELAALHQSFTDGLARCDIREIVSAHEAFGLLAHRYNFTVYGISGMNPESEPSASDLARITDLIRDHHITTVFFESLVSPVFSETLARETHTRTDVLDTLESLTPGSSEETGYTDAMMTNLEKLQTAMVCQ